MKCLICTLASGWYKKFSPLFEYTARKYNPNCDVKVFDKDMLFPGYPDNTAGALRFLVPNKYFEGYDYIYITDVDFVFLPHNPSLFDYHISIMGRTGLPYSAYRGPKTKDGKKIWHGKNTRITGGIVCVSKEWLKITERARQKILKKINGPFASRGEDEVILYRIMRCSGLKTPKKRRRFYNGQEFDKNYRNLHLGDFRDEFEDRWKSRRKARRWYFTDDNVAKYRKLQQDETYHRLYKETKKDKYIQKIFRNLKRHLEMR